MTAACRAESAHGNKSRTPGLSGFLASRYGETAEIIEVPTIRLDDYCSAERIDRIEFLKIDAGGHDFEVLQNLDLARVAPRVIMLEFGTTFAGQTLGALNEMLAQMKAQGYRSVIFAYDDSNLKHVIWSYELERILVDAPCPDTLRRVVRQHRVLPHRRQRVPVESSCAAGFGAESLARCDDNAAISRSH